MKNYERYHTLDHTTYGKPSYSDYFMKIPGNRVILPFIEKIKERNILEVGLGSGEYTRFFLKQQCAVTGVDINPHLGKELGIEIIEAAADSFSRQLVRKDYENVFSFWMTEYLSPGELEGFFSESYAVLSSGGMFCTTVIANRGWGKLYTTAAGLKGIKKYGYSEKDINNMLAKTGYNNITVLPIIGRLGILFAYFVHCSK